jgi:hypothetical protein
LIRTENQTLEISKATEHLPCFVSNPQLIPTLFELREDGQKTEIEDLLYNNREGFIVPPDRKFNGSLLLCSDGNATKYINLQGVREDSS